MLNRMLKFPLVGSPAAPPHRARAFLRQTWTLGSETGVAGRAAGHPLHLARHDPRTHFMNWALMYNGAWDYPADTRGDTIGLVPEAAMRRWPLRFGSVMEPATSNGLTCDTRLMKNRGEGVEWERRYAPARPDRSHIERRLRRSAQLSGGGRPGVHHRGHRGPPDLYFPPRIL